MPDCKGTFHFHSTYSHDGRSTLREIGRTLRSRGFRFCVMTEHFEDFDALKFERYLQEAKDVSEKEDFLLIPGVEVNLSGVDTILFPVTRYQEILDFAHHPGKESGRGMLKVIAHASKYSFAAIAAHLQAYAIDGVEIWNQQADGRHLPPLELLDFFGRQPWRDDYLLFFGCDLHDVGLTVANVASISTGEVTKDAIVRALTSGDFISESLPTGMRYCNRSDTREFDSWLLSVQQRSYRRGRILGGVRRCLKSLYKVLPRQTQHSLNDFKNFVRNKV